MAPQMPNPNEPLGEPREVDREVGGGVNLGWIWILIWLGIIALIVAIVWFGGWGWAGHGGWWWGHQESHVTRPVGNTLGGSGVAVLDATNKEIFAGHPFKVLNVPVQEKVGDHALWVGATRPTSMLVVLNGPNNSMVNADITQGGRVSVIGTVKNAPDAATAKQQWSLSDDAVQRLEQQGVYVQATEVEAVQR